MTRARPTGQPTETAASSGPRPCDGKNSAYQVVAAACASAQHAACAARASTSRPKLGAAAESAPVSAAAPACACAACACACACACMCPCTCMCMCVCMCMCMCGWALCAVTCGGRGVDWAPRGGEAAHRSRRPSLDAGRDGPAAPVMCMCMCMRAGGGEIHPCTSTARANDASTARHRCHHRHPPAPLPPRDKWNQPDGGPGGRTADAREPTTQPAGKAAAKRPRSPAPSSHSATSPSNMYAVTSSAEG
jgi:hypothetical protein